MEALYIESTPHTPLINFIPTEGKMIIRGRSIPDNADAFWMPILNWFESYIMTPSEETVFQINFEYFNISSSKLILFLLYKLNELQEKGNNVRVEWYHRKDDTDMFEVGQDYAYMVKVPFEFKEFKEEENLIA